MNNIKIILISAFFISTLSLVFPSCDVTIYDDLSYMMYTVTYDGNGNTGGTVPAGPKSYDYGATVTVLRNTGNLVKTNYVFNGWNTESDGKGLGYAMDDTFTMEDNPVTLYAQWQPYLGYNLRDIGPAGGLIFYINDDYLTDGWRYMEAAPNDVGSMKWGDEIQIPGSQGEAIGAGYQNTIDILATANSAWAARACDDHVSGGYTDWFLPSFDELYEMHQELYLQGVGNFVDGGRYWSSTETDMWYPPTYAIHTLQFTASPDLWYWQGQSWVSYYYVHPARRF